MRILKFFSFMLLVTLLAVLTGCAKEVVVPEVLQQPINSNVYLNCNIWYQNPKKINSQNIQSGRILPIGTMVTPTSASENHVAFTDANGVDYYIEFDAEDMMIPVQEYIRRIFTITPPDELLKDIPPDHAARIKAGQVVPKMTRSEVLLAFGYPVAGRTPSLKNSSYLYYTSPESVLYVVFEGDKVRRVFQP